MGAKEIIGVWAKEIIFMPCEAMENIGGKKPNLTFKVRFVFSFWFEEVDFDPREKI